MKYINILNHNDDCTLLLALLPTIKNGKYGNKAPIYILNYDHLVIKASTLTLNLGEEGDRQCQAN